RINLIEQTESIIEIQLRRLPEGHHLMDLLDMRLDVAVGSEQIEIAVEVDIEQEKSERQRHQAWMPEFRAGDVVHEEPVPNVPIDANGLMREIPDEECDLAGRVHHTGVGAHAGARTAVRVEGDTRPNAPLLERPISPVRVEQMPLRVFCKEQIGPSILVVTQLQGAKAPSRDGDEARPFRSLCDRALAVVLAKAR